MTPTMPERKTPRTPDVFAGEIFQNVGKYARGAVLYAFERIGGPDGLASWANDNPDDFYTKLFPKIIARESEVTHSHTVDSLMDVLDGDYEVAEFDEDTPALAPSRPVPPQVWDDDEGLAARASEMVEFEG